MPKAHDWSYSALDELDGYGGKTFVHVRCTRCFWNRSCWIERSPTAQQVQAAYNSLIRQIEDVVGDCDQVLALLALSEIHDS